jgi:hypothetical protein
MRVISAWRWTPHDSASLAVFSSKLATDLLKGVTSDDRDPTTQIVRDADSAYVLASIRAAEAARAAATHAFAADAACNPAYDRYARSAAQSASCAAQNFATATRANPKKVADIEKWVIAHLTGMEKIVE